jgi:hypothetical protein
MWQHTMESHRPEPLGKSSAAYTSWAHMFHLVENQTILCHICGQTVQNTQSWLNPQYLFLYHVHSLPKRQRMDHATVWLLGE